MASRGWLLGVVLWFGLAPGAALADEEPGFRLQAVDQDTWLLERPRASVEGVEGFLVDSSRLIETLEVRVLEARNLGSVARLSRPTQASRPVDPRRFEFDHRFAPPFSAVVTRLELSPLEDGSDGVLTDRLVLSLAVSVVLGLYALYRMTATQLAFAERSRDFVSAVSHELKTPLTAIRMYGEMLADDLVSDEEKQRSYHRSIVRESERLTRLIDNVLTLSRIERHHPLLLQLGDVSPHVRDAVVLLEAHAAQQGYSLLLSCDEDLPRVWFEPDAIKQVVFNLVDNSMKYGGDASDKRIVVECRRGGKGVTLTVRDYGPGVAPGHVRRIFLPFFRGERELTRKHSGTGIGLGLVSSLVGAMKGRVSAENLSPGLRVAIRLVGEATR
jgi:signal transduction histidine kinase